MPPKAKAAPPAPPQDDGSAERVLMEKELVIAYMKSKLGRYQANGDRLQLENIRLNEDLDTQKLNLRDINDFLTNELKARSLTTNALEAKLFDLNLAMEEARKAQEAAMTKLKAEKDKEVEARDEIIAEFKKKSKLMQDHLDNKERMDAELASLKAEIEALKTDYEHRLLDVDRQHIQDREKWKRDTAQKIKETKIKMMKLTDNQLEMTTKRTIMENEQMSIELSYQSRQTEKLMAKNTILVTENADLRRQLGLSKQTEDELARRNTVYQRTIKGLLAKLDEQGTSQEESVTLVKELEDRASDAAAQVSLLRLQLEEQHQQKKEVQKKLSAKTTELQDLQSSYDSTARFLAQCMEDVRAKIVTIIRNEPTPPPPVQHHYHHHHFARTSSAGSSVGPSSVAGPLVEPEAAPAQADIAVLPGRLDELTLEQRERVLAHLLERLHVHAATASAAPPPSSSASSIALPPIPKYTRRNPAASTPISQHMVPAQQGGGGGPASHYPHVGVAATHGGLSASYAPSLAAPSHAGQPAPSVAGTSQVAATIDATGTSVHASWPQAQAHGHAPHHAPPSNASTRSAGGFGGFAGTGAGAARGGGWGGGGSGRGGRAQGGSEGSQAAGSEEGHSTLEVAGQGQGQAAQGLEIVEEGGLEDTGELISKVMGDVRPWGKRAKDSLVAAPAAKGKGGGGGVFLKANKAGSPSLSTTKLHV